MKDSIKYQSISSKNVSFYSSSDLLEYYPTCVKEVLDFIKLSNNEKKPFYTISTGYNWGLGSKVPTNNTARILNLSKLDQIIEFDKDTGVVVIEPGVTQKQLCDFLKKERANYFLDVTGSSMETSIVGNTLERGISYNRMRADAVVGLEVITGKGDTVKVGNWRNEKSKLKYGYKYGVGPDLLGLFFQSNFGVITKMAFKLLKKDRFNYLVQLKYKSIADVSRSLDAISKLQKDGDIKDVFHIANSERAEGILIPYYNKCFEGVNPRSIDRFRKYLGRNWVCAGIIRANSRADIKVKSKVMRKELSPFCDVFIISESFITKLQKILNRFKFLNLFKFLTVTSPFRRLYFGEATNATIGGLIDFETFKSEKELARFVDKSEKGFLYCLPITKMSEKECNSMIEVINRVAKKFNFDPAITLNPVNGDILEAVVSVEFEQSRKEKAHDCIREMQVELIENGHFPYRTNIKDMNLYKNDLIYESYLKNLKKAFDPNNIISPGRYVDITTH